ncbi:MULTISPECIES: hypothetical protein [Acinetobacter]|uniref:hypothetical protein n=1 Tax=Acinetobacter TaxID=469 RepID=UPI000F73B3B6|nr:hypothetical protein [Acinetobacter haemolyticus]MEB6678069.1 hypothetical protein [Acinetobacter haemolyticus]NAR61073.1 hypothetical protein [Acinetobacter haemolyticus]NAR71397.1 hypothetical protein [Acinetobacter haemolyticus]NAR93340.1 hypothetical protein [Acinetobacter haemolyticus]QHI23232.1 hypothetical protein Ahae5227_10245 [Acinetobacter haemolyticus]
MMAKYKQFICVFLFGLLISACQPKASQYMNHQQTYILHLGSQGVQDFMKYTGGQVDHQPAGMNFMELDWNPPNLGKVRIEHGVNSLELDHVFSVMGAQLANDPNIKGIKSIVVNAGLTQEEFVEPKQAYAAYVELMQKINNAGWKNYFYRFSGRVAKEDNLKYLLKGRDVIDPSYIFTFDEWVKVINTIPTKSLAYRLYSNGIILNISLKQTALNEHAQEQYMLRYSFQTIRYDERNSIAGSYKMNASELEEAFKEMLERNKQARLYEEKKLETEGYRIDKSYKDPDVWPYVK